jgi:hypothetical protein
MSKNTWAKTRETAAFASPFLGTAATQTSTFSAPTAMIPSRELDAFGLTWHAICRLYFFGKGWFLLRDLVVTFSIRRRRGVARLLMDGQ